MSTNLASDLLVVDKWTKLSHGPVKLKMNILYDDEEIANDYVTIGTSDGEITLKLIMDTLNRYYAKENVQRAMAWFYEGFYQVDENDELSWEVGWGS